MKQTAIVFQGMISFLSITMMAVLASKGVPFWGGIGLTAFLLVASIGFTAEK